MIIVSRIRSRQLKSRQLKNFAKKLTSILSRKKVGSNFGRTLPSIMHCLNLDKKEIIVMENIV